MQDPGDWRRSLDVVAILHEPEVRERIAAAGREAGVRTDATTFLNRVEAAAGPLVGLGASNLAGNAVGAHSFWTRLGVRVRRERTEDFGDPAGELVARTLVSMARQGLVLTTAGHDDGRCTLRAQIPSDMRTFGGIVDVDIEPGDTYVRVHAEAVVPGQGVDWGRCRGILRRLFDELRGPS